jgi:hypothetical protein
MLTPSLPHTHFFHFSETCYLGSNDSIKFLESIVIFDSFSEGCSTTGYRMLWNFEVSPVGFGRSKLLGHISNFQ